MTVLINAATAVTTSQSVAGVSKDMAFSLAVVGTGTVSASAMIEGSVNGVDWFPLATLTASGTTRAADGGNVRATWTSLRARLTAISGTSAAATVEILGV